MSLRKTGYMDSEVVGCQFSVYPLRQESIDAPVQAAIKAAAEQEYGSAVLIATLAAGIPGDELVSSIQADVNKETNTNEAAQPNRGASESAAAKGRE